MIRPRPTLETLPAELREMIYLFLFRAIWGKWVTVPFRDDIITDSNAAIFIVNKKIGLESRDVFYREIVFVGFGITLDTKLPASLARTAPLFQQAVFHFKHTPRCAWGFRYPHAGVPPIELCPGVPLTLLKSPDCRLSIVNVHLGWQLLIDLEPKEPEKGPDGKYEYYPTYNDLINQLSEFGEHMRSRGGVLRVIVPNVFPGEHFWDKVKGGVEAIEDAAARPSATFTFIPRKESAELEKKVGFWESLFVHKNHRK